MRPPDLTIGPRDNPQTERWHIFKWRGFQLALHKWHRSDDDRALHDHTAWNVSVLLNRPYREIFADREVTRWPFVPVFRRGETPHRIALFNRRPVWTLWLRGPPVREWGFHCPKGWRHWKEYIGERDYRVPGSTSTVGRGCD